MALKANRAAKMQAKKPAANRQQCVSVKAAAYVPYNPPPVNPSYSSLPGTYSGSNAAPYSSTPYSTPAPPSYSPTPAPTGTAVAGAPARPPLTTSPNVFTNVEGLVAQFFNSSQPGHRTDWREIEGAYVLYPPNGRAPEAVVHFLGGAFIGAAPQISYRLFLEALANRNILVVCTPYATGFDHLRIADECQFKFDRALRYCGPEVMPLPVYGVGHSLGAVIHMLISSRYAVARAGNALLAFNNRNATDTIPFLAPIIAPTARLVGPILAQIAASPVRSTVESAMEMLRNMSPSILRQVSPLVEQLAPMYLDLSQGKQEYTPSPEETRHLIRSYYTVPRNLLLRFKDDGMDETNSLVQLLQSSPTIGETLDMTVRTLPGGHLRPMHQAVVDIPAPVARLANQTVYTSGDLIGRLAGVATQMGAGQMQQPLSEVGRGVSNMANWFGGEVGGPVADGMQSLADEVAAWMGVGAVVVSGNRALPAQNVYERQQQVQMNYMERSGAMPTTF